MKRNIILVGVGLALVSVLPLAVASNVLRVTVLAVLAEWLGYGILDTPIHVVSGYATFVLTLVLIFTLAERPRSAQA